MASLGIHRDIEIPVSAAEGPLDSGVIGNNEKNVNTTEDEATQWVAGSLQVTILRSSLETTTDTYHSYPNPTTS